MDWTVIKGDNLFFQYKGDGLFTVRILDIYAKEVKDSKKHPSEDRVNIWVQEVNENAEDYDYGFDIPDDCPSDMFCHCSDYEMEETDEDVKAYRSSRGYKKRQLADPFATQQVSSSKARRKKGSKRFTNAVEKSHASTHGMIEGGTQWAYLKSR